MKTILSSKVTKKPRLSEILSKKPKPPKKRAEPFLILKCLEYATDDILDLLNCLRVSKPIAEMIRSAKLLWLNSIPKSMRWPLRAKIAGIESKALSPKMFCEQIVRILKEESVARVSKRLASLQKLFAYNTTKENVVNQLIETFNIYIRIFICDALGKTRKYLMKKDNYSSYYFAIYEMQQFKFYDTMRIRIEVRSKDSNIRFEESFVLSEQTVLAQAVGLKVYAFHTHKNLMFVNFRDDSKIMFMFYQISIMEIIHRFSNILKQKMQSFSAKPITAPKKALAPLSLSEQLAFKTDFEFILSFYNCKQRVLYYINTRLMPKTGAIKDLEVKGNIISDREKTRHR
jgi:hypothetical protein